MSDYWEQVARIAGERALEQRARADRLEKALRDLAMVSEGFRDSFSGPIASTYSYVEALNDVLERAREALAEPQP